MLLLLQIRKWSKIKYGDQVEKKKGGFLSKLGLGSKSEKDNVVISEESNDAAVEEVDEESSENQDSDVVDDIEESNSTEPEWFKKSPRRRSPTKTKKEGQSVFSIEQLEDQKSDLPKSDSAKLVLARTHFILENEHLLPPYHVF
jgi:hypothetical protein